MDNNYKKILPLRFQDVSYDDVPNGIKEISTKQIKTRNGVYFIGESGVGKTHIVCGIAKNLLENGIDVLFFNTGDFLEKLREEFTTKSEEDDEEKSLFRKVMDFNGVLIFDDIGAEKVSEWSRERLYLIINKKYEDMQPVLFTSNCDMEILSARMGDRIMSRIIGMTEIVTVEGADRRIKN